MNVEKISTKKISETVAEQIEKLIESGNFQSGEKLPSVRELCELFGVGRTAVRDAIISLKGKGLVDVKQGEGTYICHFDPVKHFSSQLLLPSSQDIQNLFQVRKMVETGIAEIAAGDRTSKDLDIMKQILKKMNGWEADYQFHTAIAKATGNDILIQLLEVISVSMKKAMVDVHQYVERNDEAGEFIKQQHQAVFEAIVEGKPDLAKEKMYHHLNYVEELLYKS